MYRKPSAPRAPRFAANIEVVTVGRQYAGKDLQYLLSSRFGLSRRTAKADGAVKDASDWRLTADVGVDLGKGWSISSNVKYQSEVATFFSKFDEYWALNARVQKKFKKVTLFFDGRDLLDSTRQTTVESADGNELWVDVARAHLRLLILGIQWKF